MIALALLAAVVVPASGALAAAPRTSPPAAGSFGIQLLGPPVEAQSNPLAHLYIVGRLAPGTSISRRVEISNDTHSIARVTVYPAAAGLHRGRFGFSPGHAPNELSRWMSVSRSMLLLPAGGKALETVTVKVPAQASPGDRYAVVWAEMSAPAPHARGVRLVNRVGVRVYLSVGPGGLPAANFVVGALRAQRSSSGQLSVIATVRNTGGRAIILSGSLTLSDGPGGVRARPVPVDLGTPLARGRSEQVVVSLDKRLQRGPWRARLRLSTGLIQRTVDRTITFPRAAAASTAPASTAPRASAAPAGSSFLELLAYVLAGLAAVALMARVFIRRGR